MAGPDGLALRAGSKDGDLGLEVGAQLEGAVDGGEAQVGDDVELLERLEDRQANLVGGDLRAAGGVQGCPPRARRAGRGRPRTGRPWQALRTPLTTSVRLNGSVTPQRLTTARLISSTVVKRRPHSGHEGRRHMASPSVVSRLLHDAALGVPGKRAALGCGPSTPRMRRTSPHGLPLSEAA